MFPRRCGRLVLDGPPDYWISARDYAYRQGKGFMDALDAFLDWCQQTGCSLAASGAPRDQLTQLIARVDQAPLPAVVHDNGVTREGDAHAEPARERGALDALRPLARMAAPGRRAQPAVNSRDRAALLAFSDQYLGRTPDGHYDALIEANSVIDCVDRPAKGTPTTASELADVADFQAAAPAVGRLVRHRVVRRHAQAGQGRQARRRAGAGHRPDPGVGTTGDPATPYAGAQAMAARIAGLRPAHLRQHRAHRVRQRASARASTTPSIAYLVDGTLPAPGTHCAPN